jgi:nucleoside-diphosphate-sugar epimerase
MKVAITGGTGFVGSHSVAAVIAAGHKVRLLVRDRARVAPALEPHGLSPSDCEYAVADVNDAAAIRRGLEGCEAVIHAGSAYTYALPFWRAAELIKTNVRGTGNVLQTAHEMHLDPIVYVSSSWAILQSRPTTLTETTPPGHPPDAYPQSKAQAEVIARNMQAAGAPIVITYPGGVWGPHDPHWGETAQLVETTLKGVLRFAPDGTTPFSDVREVARLHAAVLAPNLGPRRYLVPSHSPRFVTALRTIVEAAGRNLRITAVPGTPVLWSAFALHLLQSISPFRLPLQYAGAWYVTRNNVYGESRAEREFGIAPRPFEQSVRDTVSWMIATGRLRAAT